uniref:Peptidase M13 C-terminal domain-containing protein n=1 Tax=Strigamia maritima TaxID=126957 RepID=T1JJ61_STRMM
MIDQYGNYTEPETGEKLNGRSTLGENIADNGGLKEAYYAYRTWAQHHEPEMQLPGLNYTTSQLFWMSYATMWCIKQRPEQTHLQIEFGVHSLGRFRVNGPLSNMQAFSDDYHCPIGSPLNPVSKCNVW